MAKSAPRKKQTNSKLLARRIAQAAHDLKATAIEVIDLGKLSSFTDFFVIASGRSDRQVQAICDRIQDDLAKQGRRPIGLEGYAKGHWVLVDFGEVVAHIFYEELRPFYSLEKLWGDAPRLKFRLK